MKFINDMNSITRNAIIGAGITAILIGAWSYASGEISGFKALKLFEESLPGMNILCNTIILGSTTILALMLTLLSVSKASESDLNEAHYDDILTLSRLLAVLIAVSTVFLILINLPLNRAEGIERGYYDILYYSSLAIEALIAGGFIGVIMILYGILKDIVLIIGMGLEDHPLVHSKKEKEEIKEEVKEEE